MIRTSSKVAEIALTKEMQDFFFERTNKHISLVQKYCDRIYSLDSEKWKSLPARAKVHDSSKFENPEFEPYVGITWYYKCKNENTPCQYIPEMHSASEHHVRNNRHHVEFYNDDIKDVVNQTNRDQPSEKPIDGSAMEDIDIAEMVADWCAMSEEKGTNTPREWADKNISSRWVFSEEQKILIYELLDSIWN